MSSLLKRTVLDQAKMLISDLHHRFFESSGSAIPCHVDLCSWLKNASISETFSITSLMPQDQIANLTDTPENGTEEITMGIFPVYLPASLGLSVEAKNRPFDLGTCHLATASKTRVFIAPQQSAAQHPTHLSLEWTRARSFRNKAS